MEIALVISSLAGAAAAATINRLPKNKNKMPLLGANSQIRAQINSLKIEKEILTKTISRLYQGTDLPQAKRDKLLSRYQHQLGVILSKIEKLEESSKYPDLGPLGDGLMSLMDQKLSALDRRLVEISSKITASGVQMEKPEAKNEKRPQEKPEISTQSIDEMIRSFAKPATKMELTTLTAIPAKPVFDIPVQLVPAQTAPQADPYLEQIVVQPQKEMIQQTKEIIQPMTTQSIAQPIDIEKQVRSEPPKLEFREAKPEQERRKSKANIPEPEEPDDDEDDLDSIKREIMKTLSKLEQAEVE